MKQKFTTSIATLAVIMLFGFSASVFAQPWEVTGSLQTQNVNYNPNADFDINEPIVGAEVKLFDGATELDVAITDVNGAYSLTHSVDTGELQIFVAATSALQERTIEGIPTGKNHDLEGVTTVRWVEGSVVYHGVRYRTVTIGDQIWMAENLRTNKYRNGEAIPNVEDDDDWSELSTGAWVIHENPEDGEDDVKNFNRGKLYNWYAVNDARGLCPVGWDVPSDDDFKELEEFLGMPAADLDLTNFTRGRDEGVGNKLRSTGGGGNFFYIPLNTQEGANNAIATNLSGFSARGTGLRFAGGSFGDSSENFEGLGRVTHLWTSTENSGNTSNAFRRVLTVVDGGINRNSPNKRLGLAVRCVQTQDNTTSSLDFSGDDGGAGWRMMSVPFAGVTVSDLASQNQVSGFRGANSFYGVDNLYGDDIKPNMFFFDSETYDSESDDPTGWVTPQNFNAEIPLGQGFIWYLFDDDSAPSVALADFELSITGVTPEFDVDVPLEAGTWNLIGNPFASNLSANELSTTGLQSNAAQVWDSSNDTYVVVDFTGDNSISKWQGFFIESDDATSFTIPQSAKTEDEATFFSIDEDSKRYISFTLAGSDKNNNNTTLDKAIRLVLDENASHGWDQSDVRKLTPLKDTFATLAFVGERDEKTLHKAQESRPISFEETVDITMALNLQNIDGTFTLAWDGVNATSNEMYFSLIDHQAGTVVDMNSNNSYSFEATSEKAETAERFTLSMSNVPLSSEFGSELPRNLTLSQNYPNPFNPTTQIAFDIPQESHVRLSVYDLLGREIAILVNEQRAPGSYQITWDASRMSSGVYFYRLEAEGNVLSRRMTLIK